MDIENAENCLFAKWRERRPDLVPDGLCDEQAYIGSHVKLLFVLKEVNEKEEVGSSKRLPWDLRQFMRDGAPTKWQTWNSIARWVTGIRHLPKPTAWGDVDRVDHQMRKDVLRGIGAMNLKKSPGRGSTRIRELTKAARDDSDLLAEQFRLYDADIVICCGRSVADLVDDAFHLGEIRGWESTAKGVRFKEYMKAKFVISYLHPQARCSKMQLFFGIVEAIAELRQKNGC